MRIASALRWMAAQSSYTIARSSRRCAIRAITRASMGLCAARPRMRAGGRISGALPFFGTFRRGRRRKAANSRSPPMCNGCRRRAQEFGGLVHSLGFDSSDIIVTTARGVHAEALAEFVMLCVLAYTKDLPRLIRDQKAHRWERYCCRDLVGKTMLIVGAGQVGAQAGRVARAFGLRVEGVVNRKDASRAAALGTDVVLSPRDLHAALGRADYVVLSTPHTPQTDRMIDRRAFASMKPGVVVINIARGAVVDEEALIDNLRSGHVAFAGLDVVTSEPLAKGSPLWDMPNVLISPHSASTAPSENGKITDIFCRNLAAWLDQRPQDMINVLDKKRRY